MPQGVRDVKGKGEMLTYHLFPCDGPKDGSKQGPGEVAHSSGNLLGSLPTNTVFPTTQDL